eukprot:ANDGO_04377.mRNA.1 hypothetical protein
MSLLLSIIVAIPIAASLGAASFQQAITMSRFLPTVRGAAVPDADSGASTDVFFAEVFSSRALRVASNAGGSVQPLSSSAELIQVQLR